MAGKKKANGEGTVFRLSEKNGWARFSSAKATAEAYFSKWLKDYQYNKLKPASYDRVESTAKKYIIPSIGKLRMDKVTRDKVQELINTMYKVKKLSYPSIKKVYIALNACFNRAMICGIVLKTPVWALCAFRCSKVLRRFCR